MSLDAGQLMSLEAYARERSGLRPGEIAHRRLRSVSLGEHLRLQFEDERTVRYQLQEMLRAERLFEPEDIRREIEAYAPLLPDGRSWRATLLIEYADPAERRVALQRLVGIEARLHVDIAGESRVYAVPADGRAAAASGRTSAVHFLAFRFTAAQCGALKAGAACVLGCDHPLHVAQAVLSGPTLDSLRADL